MNQATEYAMTVSHTRVNYNNISMMLNSDMTLT